MDSKLPDPPHPQSVLRSLDETAWNKNGPPRFLTFTAGGIMTIGGLLFFSMELAAIFPLNTLFFPVNQPLYVSVFIERPIGTDINSTDATTREIERRVFAVLADPKISPALG